MTTTEQYNVTFTVVHSLFLLFCARDLNEKNKKKKKKKPTHNYADKNTNHAMSCYNEAPSSNIPLFVIKAVSQIFLWGFRG